MKNKLLKSFILVVASIISFSFCAYAGTGGIYFSDPTVTRNTSFNLTIKVRSNDVRLKTADFSFSYDPNIIEYVSGTDSEGENGLIHINGKGLGNGSGTRTLEFLLKFTAKQAGVTNAKILTQEVYDATDNLVNITHLGSSKITVKPLNTQSKNANLKTLEFTPGEMMETFEPSVLEYNTEVNSDVTSLNITALAEDEDAKVEAINGNENFVTGMNKVSVVVVAPNGTTRKTYVINVNKLETGVTLGDTVITSGQKITSNTYTITISKKPDGIDIPEGYTTMTVREGTSTDGIEGFGPIDAMDENGNWLTTPRTYLLYGVNNKGEYGFYRYDADDLTIQKYHPDPKSKEAMQYREKNEAANSEIKRLKKKCNTFIIISVIAGALAIVLLIVLLISSSNGEKNTSIKKRTTYDDDDDDDDSYFTKVKKKSYNDDRRYDDSNDDIEIEDLD